MADGQSLRRDLGLTEATTIMVGSMIGSGIFLGPQEVAQAVPSFGLVLLVWVAAGLLSFFGALTYAELAAMLPRSGGQYVYMREAYGPFLSFLNGWSIFTVSKTASVGALAVGFAVTLAGLVALPAKVTLFWGLFSFVLDVKLIAIALIVGLSAVNYVGVKYGGVISNVSTGLKVLALLGLGALGLGVAAGGGAAGVAPPTLSLPEGAGLLGALGVGMVAALWAFDGWVNGTQVAEEIRDPERNLPRSLVLGTAAVTLVYLFINFVYLRTLGVEGFAASDFPAGDTVRAIAGDTGLLLLSLGILVSIFGTLNAVILSGPRIYYAMARDGVFFNAVRRVHPRFGTPHVSIVLQAAWSVALVALGPSDPRALFSALFTYVIFVTWLFFAMGGIAVFVLRRKRPDLARPFRVPGYPVVPALFAAGSIAFVVNTLIELPVESLVGLGLLATGVPFYAYWAWRARREPRRVVPVEDGSAPPVEAEKATEA